MRSLRQLQFDFVCRSIFDTPPLIATRTDIAVVSMVCHYQVIMYLIAIKSFCRGLAFTPKIFVLSDGSLDLKDQNILRKHIPGVVLVDVSAIEQANVPKGGTWERLLYIAALSSEYYVIQLDSDTVSFDNLDSVKKCIETNTSFTLCAWGGTQYVQQMQMVGVQANAVSSTNYNSQATFERALAHATEYRHLQYVQGNSGFAGFAKESITVDLIATISRMISSLIGDKIHEWGSEQIASNIAVAMSSTPVVLPDYDYVLYNGTGLGDPAFVHFPGRHRFDRSMYLFYARDAVDKLMHEATKETIPEGSKLQEKGSRLRGEGSRMQAEAARLRSSDIAELQRMGTYLWNLGEDLSRIGDKTFAKGSKLLKK